MDERFARLRRLVCDASLLRREERERFLETSCAGDAQLLAEARELCDSADRDDGFLAPPSAQSLVALLEADPTAALVTGVEVGGFSIVRLLGSGGMGTVFEAEQRDPRRRVALKILRSGVSEPESVRRFRREAILLGRLRHPSIAQIYASGVHVLHSGGKRIELPYLAMEYVEGARPLLLYAREQDLAPKGRLALFLEVCDAVQHGHSKGIIHRDLKPDNLLVDEHGRPKVIDFGVAHVTEADAEQESSLTRTGTILGTLAYMSPEQLAGDFGGVDARSDVWSLGVVLYRLCTGSLPFGEEPRPIHTLARAVQDEAPRRPSSVDPAIPKDLELVILKCLEKDPSRRYESAGALRADLAHFLAGEAITARPPSRAYQVRVFARRHRVLVGAVALVFVATAAAAVVSAASALRAARSRSLAERRLTEWRSLTRTLIHELHDSIARLPGATSARKLLIDTATTYLEGLAREADDDLELLRDLQQGYTRLGEVQGLPRQSNLGQEDAAQASLQRALALGRRRLELDPDAPDVVSDLVATLCALGSVELASGRGELAMGRFDEALERCAALAPESHATHGVRIVGARVFRGNALAAQGRNHEALACYRQAVDDCGGFLRVHPADDELLRSHAIAWLKVGDLLGARRDLADAESALREALGIAAQRARSRPADGQAAIDLAAIRERLGSVLIASRRHAEAEEFLRANLDAITARSVADPADTDLLRRLSIAHETMGTLQAELGRLDEALAHQQQALAISEQLLQREPGGFQQAHGVAVGRLMVASILWKRARYEESARVAATAQELLAELHARDPRNLEILQHLGSASGSLGDAAWSQGRFEEARERFGEAAQRFAEALALDPSNRWLQRSAWTTRMSRTESLGRMGLEAERPAEQRARLLAQAVEELEQELARGAELLASGSLWPGDEGEMTEQARALDGWRRALAELAGTIE